MILVQDTKKPNREPFESTQENLDFLNLHFPGRYKPIQKVIVTPEKIQVTPVKNTKEEIAPAKAKRG